MKEAELLSATWYGDKPITITFPSSWDVIVVGEKDIPTHVVVLNHERYIAALFAGDRVLTHR